MLAPADRFTSIHWINLQTKNPLFFCPTGGSSIAPFSCNLCDLGVHGNARERCPLYKPAQLAEIDRIQARLSLLAKNWKNVQVQLLLIDQ